LINIHPKARGKTFGVRRGEINKTGLAATSAASSALEGQHRGSKKRMADGERRFNALRHPPSDF